MRAPGAVLAAAACLAVLAGSSFAILRRPPAPAEAVAPGARLLLDEAYEDAALGAVKESGRRVWVTMYVASSPEEASGAKENRLLQALADSHRRGVDVRVLLDAGRKWNEATGKPDGPPDDKNARAVQFLASKGVPVRLDGPERILHAKAVVVDDDLVLAGSHNWTWSALRRNAEASVLFRSGEENRRLAAWFEDLWREALPPEAAKP